MDKMSASLEDYLEAICEITEKSQVARVKEISARLGVTGASVVSALRVLRQKGLIAQEKYGYIRLTGEGLALARDVCSRHEALARFFGNVLALRGKSVEEDACRAEHCLGRNTIKRMMLLEEFLAARSRPKHVLLKRFRKYVEKKGVRPL